MQKTLILRGPYYLSGVGTAVARTKSGRVVVAWLERASTSLDESGILATSTADGVSWTGPVRLDANPGLLTNLPTSVELAMGAADNLAVLWEEPRESLGTTTIWRSTGLATPMTFGSAARVDQDARTSPPNARFEPALATDGVTHVLVGYTAMTHGGLPDLYVTSSSDRGQSFLPPTRLPVDALDLQDQRYPTVALASDGTAWAIAQTQPWPSGFNATLWLFRSSDYGATWEETPVQLGESFFYGRVRVAAPASGGLIATWLDEQGRARRVKGGGPGTPIEFTTFTSGTPATDATICSYGDMAVLVVGGDGSLRGWFSSDGGVSFGDPHVFPGGIDTRMVDVACGPGGATALWQEFAPHQEVRAASLQPSGWSPSVGLASIPSGTIVPQVTRQGDVALATWYTLDGAVFVARSADQGVTWSPAFRLDADVPGQGTQTFFSTIASDPEGRAWVFWLEQSGAENSIHVRRSHDFGVTWGPPRRLDRIPARSLYNRYDIFNAEARSLPGVGLLAYVGWRRSDWLSTLVNGDDVLDEDRDGSLNQLDNCPITFNPDQADVEGDGIGDACDNCPSDYNPAQSDFNGDSQGDRCDLNDGLIYVFNTGDPGYIEWQAEQGFSSWNVYEGDLGLLRSGGPYTQLPGSNPLAERHCLISNPWVEDFGEPAPGTAAFHLVTGVAGGVESSLGTDSAGGQRPNSNPCP